MTGPESLSHLVRVKMIGRVLGRPLRIEKISEEEGRAKC
jgi:hypothetical protein